MSGVSGRLYRCLLLASMVLLQACDPAANAPKGTVSGRALEDQRWSVEIVDTTLTDADIHHEDGISYANNIHDVDYEVHGALPGVVKIHGESITITSGSNHLEVKEGVLAANGNNGGNIQQGDKVLLDADGQLWINKKKR